MSDDMFMHMPELDWAIVLHKQYDNFSNLNLEWQITANSVITNLLSLSLTEQSIHGTVQVIIQTRAGDKNPYHFEPTAPQRVGGGGVTRNNSGCWWWLVADIVLGWCSSHSRGPKNCTLCCTAETRGPHVFVYDVRRENRREFSSFSSTTGPREQTNINYSAVLCVIYASRGSDSGSSSSSSNSIQQGRGPGMEV